MLFGMIMTAIEVFYFNPVFCITFAIVMLGMFALGVLQELGFFKKQEKQFDNWCIDKFNKIKNRFNGYINKNKDMKVH